MDIRSLLGFKKRRAEAVPPILSPAIEPTPPPSPIAESRSSALELKIRELSKEISSLTLENVRLNTENSAKASRLKAQEERLRELTASVAAYSAEIEKSQKNRIDLEAKNLELTKRLAEGQSRPVANQKALVSVRPPTPTPPESHIGIVGRGARYDNHQGICG